MLGACIGLLLLLAIVFYWLKPAEEPKSTNAPIAPPITSPLPASVPLPSIVSAPNVTLPPLPHSLKGTQVDGEIIIDDNKNLVVTKGLRRLFDYFLSAQGEESLDIIHKRVADYIRKHTPDPAATQALSIYYNYIKYLDGVASIEKQYAPLDAKSKNSPQNLDLDLFNKRQLALNTLQKNLFDDKTIKAFFGEENALNNYTIASIQANKNPNLTDAQKAQAIAAAKQQYIDSYENPDVRAQLEQQGNIEKLLEETQKLKAQGASQEQLNAMRRQYVDEKAVQRLDSLDKMEQSFDDKFTAYQQQRDTILATQGNTPSSQKAIEQLQKQNFTELEIKRLNGYEAVKKSQTPK